MSAKKQPNKKTVEPRLGPEKIFADIDPRDPIVVIDDIISQLQEMQDIYIYERELVLLKKTGDKKNQLFPRASLSSNPLIILAKNYSELTKAFLDEFYFEHQKIYMYYGIKIRYDDSLAEEIDVITWLHPVILSKTWRYVIEINEIQNPKLYRQSRGTINKLPDSKIVIIDSIDKSRRALSSLAKKRQDQTGRIAEMEKILAQIKQKL